MKDVHINNPKPHFLGDRNPPMRPLRAELPRFRDILKAVVAGKLREIAIPRGVGDSVLYHSPVGLARARGVGRECQNLPHVWPGSSDQIGA
jgi:hypothetical protein